MSLNSNHNYTTTIPFTSSLSQHDYKPNPTPRRRTTHFDTFLQSVERPVARLLSRSPSPSSLLASSSSSSSSPSSSSSSTGSLSGTRSRSSTNTSTSTSASSTRSIPSSLTISSGTPVDTPPRARTLSAVESRDYVSMDTGSDSCTAPGYRGVVDAQRYKAGLGAQYLVHSLRQRAQSYQHQSQPPLQNSNSTSRKATRRNRLCKNCYQTHDYLGPHVHSETCISLSAHTQHQSPRVHDTKPGPLTIRLPTSPTKTRAIFDAIWSCFETLKTQNEATRTFLSAPNSVPSSSSSKRHTAQQQQTMHQHKSKVNNNAKPSLRQEAPLVWLKWKAADGTRKGQTRNEKNWVDVWRGLICVDRVDADHDKENEYENGDGDDDNVVAGFRPVGWITVSFPEEQKRELLGCLEMMDHGLVANMVRLHRFDWKDEGDGVEDGDGAVRLRSMSPGSMRSRFAFSDNERALSEWYVDGRSYGVSAI